MKVVVLAAFGAAVGACTPVLYVPIVEPVEIVESVASPIDVPVHAESSYAPLVDHDPRLDQVCDELAFLVAHGGEATTALATTILRMHGIAEPPDRVIAGPSGGDDLDTRLGDDRLRPNAVVGHGASEASHVAILVYRPNIQFAAFPRAITADTELAFTLDAALTAPTVTVTDSLAVVHPPVVDGKVIIPCHREGERYVTIEATDPRFAALPLVIFPVYCKLDAPATLHTEPASNFANVTSPERRIASILNRGRMASGIAPLRRDARVQGAAVAYARDRAEGRRTDQQKIMRDAGLLAPATSWTTFHADTLAAAMDRISNSPEELGKLRDRERTSFGVGVARVADGWWVSIIYVTIPPPIVARREATLIANAIRGTDQDHYIDPITTEFAQHYAESLALGWSRDTLEPGFIAEQKVHTNGGAQVTVDKRVEIRKLDARALINTHRFKWFGVGAAQSARNGPLVGTIWIVVIYD